MLFTLFLIAVGLYAIVLLFTWHVNSKRKLIKNLNDPSLEFPSGTYTFPLGETLIYTNYEAFLREYGARYQKWGCFLYYVLFQPICFLVKAEYVKELMTKPEEFFIRDFPFQFLKLAFGESLLGVSGEKWKKQHRIIQKAFTTSNIINFFPLMVEVSKKRFLEVEKAALEQKPIDMNRVNNEIAAEVIIKSAFGCEGNESDALTQAIQDLLHSQTRFLQIPGILSLKFIPQVKRYWDLYNYLNSCADAICEERKALLKKKQETGESGSTLYTFMDLLLEARDDETGAALTDRELKDNCRAFFGAGSETTATALSWFMYHMTQNPEIFKKVVEEIDAVVPDDIDSFSYQHLAKFQYLPLVINESLRLKSPVGVITLRIPSDECQIGEWVFPKGMGLLLSIPMIHFSPENYEDPHAFKPERWLDGADKKRPYSFVPFGSGRRVCIGRYFGLLEIKIVLALFLKQYTFTRVPKPDGSLNTDPVPIDYHTPVLHLKGGLPLMIYKRVPKTSE